VDGPSWAAALLPAGPAADSPSPEGKVNDFLRRLVLVAAALTVVSPLPATAQRGDEAEIRTVAMRQGETWSHHDAQGYAALFTEDCDVVNVVGWWWKGRAELERKLTAAFTYVFRESQLTITDVQVRLLSPSIALAHARWTMTGARTPPGVPEPRAGIQTLVFTKKAERWLIAGFQNTHSVPEQPFPTGPPPPAEQTP
jgi:uncharacterized protein (TIGR02246 family)